MAKRAGKNIEAGKNSRAKDADSRKARRVLLGGFFLLVFCTFLGEMHRKEFRTRAGDKENSREVSTEVFPVQEQLEYLQQLENFMAGASIHQAAGKLLQEEEPLQKIWEDFFTITGQEILYIRDGKIVPVLEGMGLALQKNQVCFYGNFKDGKPEGVCSAIAFSDSEGLGYAYSMGLWKEGQMEGLGITGQYSPKEGGKEQNLQEQVSGVFQKDRMDGMLTYEQMDDKGHSCWWEITAKEGKTCLDARWIYQSGLGEYRLLSERESRAFFVLPQNLLEQVWWENKVPWE